jgi:hypothetical protein
MAEQARLRALVADHEIQRERIAAEHQAAVAMLEQSLAVANQEAAVSGDQTQIWPSCDRNWRRRCRAEPLARAWTSRRANGTV